MCVAGGGARSNFRPYSYEPVPLGSSITWPEGNGTRETDTASRGDQMRDMELGDGAVILPQPKSPVR